MRESQKSNEESSAVPHETGGEAEGVDTDKEQPASVIVGEIGCANMLTERQYEVNNIAHDDKFLVYLEGCGSTGSA